MTYKEYNRIVKKETNQKPVHLLENYKYRGRSGKVGAYQLDHIYSIRQGFKNNIDPHIIANIKNLRFIPWEENLDKSSALTNDSWDMFTYFIEEGTI